MRVEYSTVYRVEAVRLWVELGSNYAETRRELAKRHPERKPPRAETLRRWVKVYSSAATTSTPFDRSPETVWATVELAALDALLVDVQGGSVPANVLYAIAGVAADKRLKARELDKGKSSTVHHIHELVANRRAQLIAEAQKSIGATEEEAGEIIDAEYTPLLPQPNEPIRIDMQRAAVRRARD